MTSIITLSIEPIDGSTYQHGYHLGTDENIARQFAASFFHGHADIRTVALIRDRKLIDVFDGRWFDDYYFEE